MNNVDLRWLSYLSGVFDGEGSIQVCKISRKDRKEKQFRLYITLSMTDIVIPMMFYDRFGGYLSWKIGDTYKLKDGEVRNRRKPCLVWSLQNREAYEFLCDVKPFIIGKYEQVLLGISFWSYKEKQIRILKSKKKIRVDGKLHGGESYPSSVYNTLESYYDKMHNINVGDINRGMNSVEILKKQTLRQYRAKREDYEKTLEGVETKLRQLVPVLQNRTNTNKTKSVPEKDIVQITNGS